ncbi:ribonuclease H family protein [Indiicoccus explosivorum]|uniref:ribonuclease H family protein n=1 Tax=Indiicoccus explosivorum TaxID=1917864 RepID=UPI000B43AF8B|nr:ribonuclease H family protein [Indiicoccus explosivorum]
MKGKLSFTYETPKKRRLVFTSAELSAEDAILFAGDLDKTGRAKDVEFIDRHDSSWTMKELKGYVKGVETDPHNVRVFFDGGFNRETKRAGLGCAIYYEQNGKKYRLRRNAPADGIDSNNEAEYAAFFFALQELDLLGVHHLPVEFIGDSQVVISQLAGDWPVLEPELNRWADRIEQKMESLGIEPEYAQVSRKKNLEADQLATQALNGIDISGAVEIKGD